MLPFKYLLAGVAAVAIASIAYVATQDAPTEVSAPAAVADTGTGSHNGFFGGGVWPLAGSRDHARPRTAVKTAPPTVQPQEGVPPLLAADAPPPEAAADPAREAARAARRAARAQRPERSDSERAQRRAFREKWRELPDDQRRAVKAQCKAQGFDKHSTECLKLVENATAYPVPAPDQRQRSRPPGR